MTQPDVQKQRVDPLDPEYIRLRLKDIPAVPTVRHWTADNEAEHDLAMRMAEAVAAEWAEVCEHYDLNGDLIHVANFAGRVGRAFAALVEQEP